MLFVKILLWFFCAVGVFEVGIILRAVFDEYICRKVSEAVEQTMEDLKKTEIQKS